MDLRLTTSQPAFPANAWEHVLASLEEGIVVIDQDRRIAFLNPTAATLIGQSPAQVGHQPYSQVFAANAWIVDIIERTLHSAYSPTASEGIITSRRQRLTPARATCSPIFNDTTRLLGLSLVLHDLSYQKELAEEARRADHLAQLGVVAAGLAHEIKNPLAGIRGAVQLLHGRLSGSSADYTAEEYTAVMIREIDRLGGLLEQLLQLTAPLRFALQPINVHKVLSDVLLLERRAVSPQIAIQTHFDPSLPDVLGDEAALAQVFRNLIKNSLQALNGCRHGSLTLSTRMATNFHLLRGERARRGRFLSIDFSDNGPGIAAEHLPQLFTPFFTTKNQGTGLGLPVSQRIIAQHGGTIRVESEFGHGAHFQVYLPIGPHPQS